MSDEAADVNSSDENLETTEVIQSSFPQLFGKYLLFEPFMDGGMATICLARHLGNAGLMADKLMAIKTIKTKWSEDEKFKQMFMDEIKIIFGLNHPNIVQSYDYGIQNSQLYIAMEFIEGHNLRQYERKLRENKKWFTIDASIYIVSEICRGLHYAHNYKSKLSGQDYKIIHRDVSPDNIMITHDGQVKIVDFGIAKATVKEDQTQTGMIKGKSSYLAPEYLRDQGDLSPLSDQFSTGLILWELLAGRKCFNEAQEVDNLTKIMECQIPDPQTYNPKVSRELSRVVMKALSKNPKNRFKDMDEFNKALGQVLTHEYPNFHSSKIRRYSEVLFSNEIQELSERLRKFGDLDIDPYVEKFKEQNMGHDPTVSNEDSNTEQEESYSFKIVQPHEHENNESVEEDEEGKEPPSRGQHGDRENLGLVKNKPEKKRNKQYHGQANVSLERGPKHKEKDYTYEAPDDEKSDSFFSKFFRFFAFFAVMFCLTIVGLAGDWFFRQSNSLVAQFGKHIESEDYLPMQENKYQKKLKENKEKKFEKSLKEQREEIDKLKI